MKRRLNKRGYILITSLVLISTLMLAPKIKSNELTTSSNIIAGIPRTITTKEVRATYYYPGDATGSTEWTASGLHISRFATNNRGWYTYNGYVVLAAATERCLNLTSGICNNWNTRFNNTTYYNYYDIITFVIDNVTYEGIVLDICGTAMAGENKIDIYVKDDASGYDGPMTILQ